MDTLHLDNTNEYKNRLTVALKAAKICVYEVDLTRQLYTFFENAEDIFGITGEKVLAEVRPYSSLNPTEYRKAVSSYFSHPDDEPIITKAFECILNGQPTSYTARMKAGDSEYIWCKLDVTPIMENEQPVRMIGVITDISEMRRQKDLLEQKVNLDGFTGLWNKEYSISTIRATLEQDSNQRHALLVMDVDRFKHFNDTYGHAEGDKILLATADHLSETFQQDSLVGRFGGDEFLIFVRNLQGEQDLEQLQKKIQSLTQITCGNHVITTSIGAALYPNDGSDFETLFQRADQALYQAKTKLSHAVFYQ